MKKYGFDTLFFEEALKEAKLAGEVGEVPVGALVVARGSREIISRGHNLCEETGSPLKHAEIIALEGAFVSLGRRNLSDCDLYVTLEPCFMCCGAIDLASIGRLFYCSGDPKRGAAESNIGYFSSKACVNRPEIYSGLFEEESSSALKEFFRKIRKNHG